MSVARLDPRLFQPLERADHLQVLVTEHFDVIFGQGERGQELLSLRAGDEVVIPDDPELTFTSLDTDLVTETAGRVAVDFASAQELDEPSFSARGVCRRETGWGPGDVPCPPRDRP